MSCRHPIPLASRFIAAVALAVLLVGCGSHSSSTAQPPAPTADVPTSSPTDRTHSHETAKAIAATFTEFFAGTTPADRKIGLVQDGQGFAAVIRAQAGGVMSQATTVKVAGVTLTSPRRATVRYTILLGGTPALKNQVGSAVKKNGHWVVGAATFCQLLTLEQSAPPLCTKFS